MSGDACFVIMPFGQPFDRYYLNIFVPAITGAGLKPLRADSIFSPSTIMADVWRFTRQAAVVLADVTGKNPNVFYELGLAHATGKPVVIVTNTLEDVPFDLKGLRVIEYDKQHEAWGTILQESILAAIKAALDDPDRAIPAIFLDRVNVNDPKDVDPLSLQLRQILDELRALRSQRRIAPIDQAQRLTQLLARHSGLLRGVPDNSQLIIFESLMSGELTKAAERIQSELGLSHNRALEIATHIAEWMRLYVR
ncbi:MAG TPA: hypothetical protein VH437_03135 [Terriglobales bacterium]|jgi:hypothetical protein